MMLRTTSIRYKKNWTNNGSCIRERIMFDKTQQFLRQRREKIRYHDLKRRTAQVRRETDIKMKLVFRIHSGLGDDFSRGISFHCLLYLYGSCLNTFHDTCTCTSCSWMNLHVTPGVSTLIVRSLNYQNLAQNIIRLVLPETLGKSGS